MKKRLIVVIVAAVLLVGGAMSASAQFRLDIDVPWWLSVHLSPSLESAIGAEAGGVDIMQYAFVLPNLQPYYQFVAGPVHFGIGARLYTVLIMNFLYPQAFVELNLGRFDINFNMGGLAGIVFGLGPTFEAFTGPGVTMDLSVGFRIVDWLRIDVGAFAVAHKDYLDQFPYVIYAGGKFIFQARPEKGT
jgi:hypothetical protein